MTIVEAARAVTGGIDTHGEVHVAAASTRSAACSGPQSFWADPDGLRGPARAGSRLSATSARSVWRGQGPMGPASPASWPEPGSTSSKWTARTARPGANSGKSDPLDAVEAARAAQSGRAHGTGQE